jgi:cytochrome c-type biogenesis protein CcsB
MMLVALLCLIVALAFFATDLYRGDERHKANGFRALWASGIVQLLSVVTLFYQIRASAGTIASRIDVATQATYPKVAEWLNANGFQPTATGIQQVSKVFANNNAQLSVSGNSNPVELGALFTLLALTGLVLLFGFRTERVISRLPSLDRLDELMYKTGAVAFTGLAMLLITGAVWANESWGRYWGWDSKETGALVAWLAYAGFLHTRIAHGWTGRRSAYFAIVGFLLVIFTYLGVSYLLPGLHSYA